MSTKGSLLIDKDYGAVNKSYDGEIRWPETQMVVEERAQQTNFQQRVLRCTYRGAIDVQCFQPVSEMPGGWRSFYRAHGMGVAAAGRAPQRYQSQPLQQVRASLGDGPSL
jgi:hypothetical protein